MQTLDLSFSAVKLGMNIEPEALDKLGTFQQERCSRGMFSLERGNAKHLHLQGVICIDTNCAASVIMELLAGLEGRQQQVDSPGEQRWVQA